MSRCMILCLMVIALLTSAERIISGQGSSDLIIRGDFDRTEGFSWSSDSTRLTFYNYDLGSTRTPLTVNTDSAGWQTIDISTGSISAGTDVWSLQPTLTEEEISLFMPREFVYPSPDTNLLIFGREPADNLGLRELAIANRTTLQVISLGLLVFSDTFSPDTFDVQWSADSHAAIVAFYDSSGAQQVIHITIPNFDNLENHHVHEFNVQIDGKPYITTPAREDRLLDLSADGQAVLLIARDSTANEFTTFYDHPPKLIIWRPYIDAAEIVGTDVVIQGEFNGSFAPNSSSTFLIATPQGLFMHHSVTRQLLESEHVNNSYEYFSPDGEWLAIVGSETIEILSTQNLMNQSAHAPHPPPSQLDTSPHR